MKLLSASAVVAGANSVALADCGLCGDKTYDHGTDTCPHFDYRGYGLSKGYKPETLPDNKFLGSLALADRGNAKAFLTVPVSSTISFATPSDNTAYTLSDTKTTIQSSNERPGASDKLNVLEFERVQDLEDRATTVSGSDADETGTTAEEVRREKAAHKITQALRENKERREKAAVRIQSTRRAQLARREREEAERGQALQNLFDEADARKEEARLARERDTRELKNMIADSLAENGERERNERLTKARELSERREALENAREVRKQEAASNSLRSTQAAANKIQNAARARLARKKAAELKAEAERQEKIRGYRENAAAGKITEALRKNKERKQAERQAQIDGDYELAKKLQAEYDAEDRQIRADRLLAEQEQLRENLAAVPVEEARNGADFEYRSEQDQINADNLLAQQEQAREYLGMNTQEQSHVTATKEAVADEEVETDRWNLPQTTVWNFQGFDFESNHRSADRWAKQLDALSVRKIECIMWLISTSYQQLQNAGNYAPTAQMAEALSDVNNIFPYSGTNSGIMNVYRAFENTDTGDFVGDLEYLGKGELDGILYYIADRYMHLLLPENGKKAASTKFIELAKATLEHFNVVWEADDAEIVPDNADVVEAPRDPVNFNAADKGIVETEAPETETWNPPYRVYYAYCHYIPHNFRPTKTSLQYHNEPDLFKANLRSLTIRRLETVIHLANTSYRLDLEDGSVPMSQEIVNPVNEVVGVFPKSGEGKPNARVTNVYNALANMLDRPNNNPVSRQPFQRGFSELSTNEKVTALGDMAVAYREMLRNGKRPASLVFVNWANAVCKALDLDGFVGGKDNIHPELKFEEFENEAKTSQVSGIANANNNPAVVAKEVEPDPVPTAWEMPEGVSDALEFRYEGYYWNADRETSNEGQARDKLRKAIAELNVRQMEALLGATLVAYDQRLGYHDEDRPTSDVFLDQANNIRQLIANAGNGGNEHLANVLETLNKADNRADFQRDVKRLPTRQIEAFIGMIAEVYGEKLHTGAVPADKSFKEFAKSVCELLWLDWEEEAPAENEATNAPRRNALEDDNRELIPVDA